jgi:hypothetical protein
MDFYRSSYQSAFPGSFPHSKECGYQYVPVRKRNELILISPASLGSSAGYSPGGLIIGMTKRIFRLTTTTANKKLSLHTFFRCLVAQGYHPKTLCPIFIDAVTRTSTQPIVPPESVWFKKLFFLHLPYITPKMSCRKGYSEFSAIVSFTHLATGKPPLPLMQNHTEAQIRTNQMIVAYHRPHTFSFPVVLRLDLTARPPPSSLSFGTRNSSPLPLPVLS